MVPRIVSARHNNAELPLGLNYDHRPHGHTQLGPLLASLKAQGKLPALPPSFGHTHDYRQGQWKMLGNGPDDSVFPGFQGAGDCTCAAVGHDIMQSTHDSGRPAPRMTGLTAIGWYSTLGGYNMHTGENDNGLMAEQIIHHAQVNGFKTDDGHVHKWGKVLALNPGDVNELHYGTFLFESVYAAWVITEAQQTQFAEKAYPVWDWVPGSPEIGGHLFPIYGKWTGVSWAEGVVFTPAFVERQMVQGFVVIDFDRYNSVTGEDAEHFSQMDEEKFLTLLVEQFH